jgi:hypothetical protein
MSLEVVMGVGKEMIGQARQFKFTILVCIMRVSLNFGFKHSLKNVRIVGIVVCESGSSGYIRMS